MDFYSTFSIADLYCRCILSLLPINEYGDDHDDELVEFKRYSSSSFQSYEVSLAYGITQCYLQPDTSELTPNPSHGTRFSYPGGMEGYVDLDDLLHTEMVYPLADGHPSKY